MTENEIKDSIQTAQDGSYIVVGCKISKESWELLQKLCKAKGVSVYRFIQMVCDTLIRYMSDKYNLTVEMEQAMSIFEHMIGWERALNLCDPAAKKSIFEATYFMAAKDRQGSRAVHVQRPYFGDWQQTWNIQHILERTFELIAPERYRRLRKIAVDLECNSILECVDKIIDTLTKDADIREIRKSFEDADRSEAGIKPVAAPYRRKLRRDIERQPGLFDKENEES